jgi:hypothetical protein
MKPNQRQLQELLTIATDALKSINTHLQEILDTEEEMNIYSRPGTQIKFTCHGGYDGEKEHAKRLMKVGDIVTVRRTDVGNSSTSVYLEEFPGMSFNSCLFSAV